MWSLLFLQSLLLGLVNGEGSKNLWLNDSAVCGQLDSGSCRANLEWRSDVYGRTDASVGAKISSRTLFYVYAELGEQIYMGSTALGINQGNIRLYSPGQVTGTKGAETIPSTPALSCTSQLSSLGQGVIKNRAQEVAGPKPPLAQSLVPDGYVPCAYSVLVTGIHHVIMYGPDGENTTVNGLPGLDVALANSSNFDTSQRSTIAAWDITVRANASTAENLDGRVFTYVLSLMTADNSLPVFLSFYAAIPDGYQYKIDTRGMDANRWIIFGNKWGFYDSDGSSPLYHDVRGDGAGLNSGLQGGVILAPPEFPLFFNCPSNQTLKALNYPVVATVPVVGSASFAGRAAANVGPFGLSPVGTFTVTSSSLPSIYEIIISRDGVDYDPTRLSNRVLRGFVAGTSSRNWDGKDNSGISFPIGGPYNVRVILHGGEYHFPMIDVESSALGGPTVTLLNAPCSALNGGCSGAFYDDRGYRALNGVQVGTSTSLCGTSDFGPNVTFSDAVLGFDSSSSQRAFGVKHFAQNRNRDCDTTSPLFGDAKGLDLWTYSPSQAKFTNLWIVSRAIIGHVWLDVNANGAEVVASEPPLQNLTILLTSATLSPITTKTDSLGNFAAEVPPGTVWVVTVTEPNGHYLTTRNNPQTVTATTGGTTASSFVASASKIGFSLISLSPTISPITESPTTGSPVTVLTVTGSPTSLAPTAFPTPAPTQQPTPTPTIQPTSSVAARNETTANWTGEAPFTVTNIDNSSRVYVHPDPVLTDGGTVTISNNPPQNDSLTSVLVIELRNADNNKMNVSNLTYPVIFTLPLPVDWESKVVDVCVGEEVRSSLPTCYWLDHIAKNWTTSGCTSELIPDYVVCSCTHLTEFAAFIPSGNSVPARTFLQLTPANIGAHPGGMLTVLVIIVFFVLFLIINYYVDKRTISKEEVQKERNRDKSAPGLNFRKRLKDGARTHHTWIALCSPRRGLTLRGVDRTFVMLFMMVTTLCVSARYQDSREGRVQQAAVAFISALASILPATVLKWLFSHVRPIGVRDEQEEQIATNKPPSPWGVVNWTRGKKRLVGKATEWLEKKLDSAYTRWILRGVIVACTIGMIINILAVSLMFDQDPYYYCAGHTTGPWVWAWVSSYAITFFFIEPVKILAFIFYGIITDSEKRGRLCPCQNNAERSPLPLSDDITSQSQNGLESLSTRIETTSQSHAGFEPSNARITSQGPDRFESSRGSVTTIPS